MKKRIVISSALLLIAAAAITHYRAPCAYSKHVGIVAEDLGVGNGIRTVTLLYPADRPFCIGTITGHTKNAPSLLVLTERGYPQRYEIGHALAPQSYGVRADRNVTFALEINRKIHSIDGINDGACRPGGHAVNVLNAIHHASHGSGKPVRTVIVDASKPTI